MIYALFYLIPVLIFIIPILIGTYLLLPKQKKALIKKYPDFTTIVIYSAIVIAFIQPYHGMKVFELSLITWAQILMPLSIIIFLIINLSKKLYKRSAILIILSILVWTLGYYSDNARKIVLKQTLNTFYCKEELAFQQIILGGIESMGYSQAHKNQFYNDKHCLITVCHEEHYGCDKPVDILGPQ